MRGQGGRGTKGGEVVVTVRGDGKGGECCISWDSCFGSVVGEKGCNAVVC